MISPKYATTAAGNRAHSITKAPSRTPLRSVTRPTTAAPSQKNMGKTTAIVETSVASRRPRITYSARARIP